MEAKKLILALLMTIPILAFGQDYCPFDFEHGIWEAYYYQASGPEAIYRSQYNDYAIGDTLVNDSLLCYKLIRTGIECGPASEIDCWQDEDYTPFNYELGIICEQDKKIYYRGELLYDFTVEVGDTIDHWWGMWGVYQVPIITEIDNVEMCGKTRKRLRTSYFTLGQTYFIEGIGSNAGLIPSYEFFESGSNLVCYSDQNCAPCSLITDVEEVSDSKAKIYPNPFKENIFIDTEITNYQATIFNQNGQAIRTFQNERNLELAELPSGVYFLGIHSDDNTYYEKMVKYE